jgi:hypothetical protein
VNYQGGAAELRRTSDGALLQALPGQVHNIIFSPDPSAAVFVVDYVNAANANSELRRATDGIVVPFSRQGGNIFSPNGSIFVFAVIYENGTTELRRTSDGVLLQSLSGQVSDITFSSNPRAPVFAVNYLDGTVELRRTADGAKLQMLRGKVGDFTFSPNASASVFEVRYEDRSAELRRITDGTVVPLSSNEYGISFSPDANTSTFMVRYADGHNELWSSLTIPRRLTDFGWGLHTNSSSIPVLHWVAQSQRLITHNTDGRA